MEKITTKINDFEHKYEILAYRELTDTECSKVISDYNKTPNRKPRNPWKDIVVIDTEIR